MTPREIVGTERDALLLEILKRLQEAGPHADSAAWDRNWEQHLAEFRANPCAEALTPKFIRPDQTVRMGGTFWRGVSEADYAASVQEWIGKELSTCENIHEFGCGSGFNLVALALMMPEKAYVGVDRSAVAAQIVREAAAALDLPILSGEFDMLEPRGTLPLGAGVFTFGAMEQLGRFQTFIEWLITQKPAKVVHVEPIPELLDENNLLDWLSIQFHKKRGYTVGLLPYLQARCDVLSVERSHFGSLMLESYARITWRPR